MKRIITGAVLIPLVLLLIFKGQFWMVSLAVAIVAGLATWEFLSLADATGARTPRLLVLACVALLFAAAFRRSDLIEPVIGASALLIFIYCTFRSPLTRVLPDSAFSVFALLYVGLSLTTLPLMWAEENGPSLLLF